MIEIEVERPHGYMVDADGLVVLKFGEWRSGSHKVPDAVDSIEYRDGPDLSDVSVAEKYRPDRGDR